MKFLINICIIFIFFIQTVSAQVLHGTVREFDENKKPVALPGTIIRWLGSNNGVITNKDGAFEINKTSSKDQKLIVSFVGYNADTILIPVEQNKIDIILTSNLELKEVVIEGNLNGSYMSKIKPLNTTVITGSGLQRAACCNLSESFQNSATVDVNYSDAVTGAKQIQMLGLAGVYSQLLVENVPAIRGIASAYGLSYVPGSWMNAIQVSKGTSSVINGYESITGQINIDYKNPQESKEKLFVNVFANNEGRMELNMNNKVKVKDNLSTMFFIHGENHEKKIDMNHDHFLDSPHLRQLNFMNRWNYDIPHVLESKSSIQIIDENRVSGQLHATWPVEFGDTSFYAVKIKTKRYQFISKNGFFLKKEGSSIGTMVSGTYHDHQSFYGLNKYNATEKNAYLNFIYDTELDGEKHKISSGISYMFNDTEENLNDSVFSRREIVPGIFSQYTFSHKEVLTIIAGYRADYHNIFGLLHTPRFHFRLNPTKNLSVRGSAGLGYHIPNVISENSSLLSTSRKLYFQEKIQPEKAINMGFGFMYTMNWFKEEAVFTIDYYRTDFKNQMIVDLDQNSSYVFIYNLKGESYSNSFQTELTFKPIKRFDVTAAFRLNDVKATINNELMEKPFISKYKGLVALSYATNFKKWQFDFTTHLNGSTRLPNTQDNPIAYQRPDKSPAYLLFYAQITKRYKSWDFYIGGENLSNFIQKDPIIAADNPFGKYFDSSMIWGPISGRMLYAGLRLTIK